MIDAPAEGTPAPVVLNAKYRPLFRRNPVAYDANGVATTTPARYTFITGGRGSAKSWHLSTFLLNLTYEAGHVILFTRYTLVSAELSIIPEFLEKIELLGAEADFAVTSGQIINLRTGSRILFRGIKTSSGNQTAKLKSIQGLTTWVLDEAEELTSEKTFDTIDLSIRHKSLPNRVILVLNPATVDHFLYERFAKVRRDDTLYIHTTWEDNRANLSESFITGAERMRVLNPTRYDHLYGGKWSVDAAGLLWTRAMITAARLRLGPEEYERVLVAVDPATTSKMESNETGIVVVGIKAKKAYVLEDLSGRYTPNQWASIAVDAARRWKASIVGETNQGGDMVRSTIKSIGERADGIRFIDVRASRGKYARAEPVFSLYEEGRVFHVGEHPKLESQMIGFNPDESDDSPDRVDALVWGVTAGLLKGAAVFVV